MSIKRQKLISLLNDQLFHVKVLNAGPDWHAEQFSSETRVDIEFIDGPLSGKSFTLNVNASDLVL